MKTLNSLAVENRGFETANLVDLSVDELKKTGGGDWFLIEYSELDPVTGEETWYTV